MFYFKTTVITVLTLFFFAGTISAQTLETTRTDAMQTGYQQLQPNDMISTFDTHETKMKGSPYLSENWGAAQIILADGKKASADKVRYDVYRKSLEVEHSGKIYELPASKIASFTLEYVSAEGFKSTYFVSSTRLKDSPNQATLLEAVDTTANFQLYRQHQAIVKQPNYNVALDAGSKDPEIVQKQVYYLYDGKEFSEIPNGKKAMTTFFADFRSDIKQYVKKKKINFKEETDLIEVVRALPN